MGKSSWEQGISTSTMFVSQDGPIFWATDWPAELYCNGFDEHHVDMSRHVCRNCSTSSTLYISSDSIIFFSKTSYESYVFMYSWAIKHVSRKFLLDRWISDFSLPGIFWWILDMPTDWLPTGSNHLSATMSRWIFRPIVPASQVRRVGRDRALKVPAACRHGVTETWTGGPVVMAGMGGFTIENISLSHEMIWDMTFIYISYLSNLISSAR